MDQTDNNLWSIESNRYYPVTNINTINTIPSGIYTFCRDYSKNANYLSKANPKSEDLLELPSGFHKSITQDILNFSGKESEYLKYGFTHKRGILLYGKQGSGKTCIMSIVCKKLIEEYNAIVIMLDRTGVDHILGEIDTIRLIEKNRLMVLVYEDIDMYMDSFSLESNILNLLDGMCQIGNVVHLATTNYIEKLPERIKNRPSRFDEKIYIPLLSEEDRYFIIRTKIKTEIDIDKWAKETEGMGFAHIMELIKSVAILNQDFESVITRLRQMLESKKENSQNYDKKEIGFTTKGNLNNLSGIFKTNGQ